MNGHGEASDAATGEGSRGPLLPPDGDVFLKTALKNHYPAVATLGFQIRELVRTQLLTATEEITVRSAELFIGYSVHNYARDPIVSLTISNAKILFAFAAGIPAAGENALRSLRSGVDGVLEVTRASPGELMILKVLVREAGRTSRPRLPVGRSGHCFLIANSVTA